MSQQLPDALVEIFKRGGVLDASRVEQSLDSNISESEAARRKDPFVSATGRADSRADVLKPWSSYCLGNMIFLRKLATIGGIGVFIAIFEVSCRSESGLRGNELSG